MHVLCMSLKQSDSKVTQWTCDLVNVAEVASLSRESTADEFLVGLLHAFDMYLIYIEQQLCVNSSHALNCHVL